MNFNRIIFFIIIITLLITGCSGKEVVNNTEMIDGAKNVIEKYYESMENSDINMIESLFYRKIELDEKMYNFDYIDKIEILSIEKLDKSLDTSKIYIDYVTEEYKVNKKDIELYQVDFKIYTKEGYQREACEEGSQKFSIIKNKESYLIGELFR
ncbi:MAG: DUF4829 domain-containing protein [Clostridium sp.]